MNKAVFCLADNEGHAQRIVTRLQNENFANDQISVLLPGGNRRDLQTPYGNQGPVHARKDTVGIENTTKAPEGATTGALTGGLLGGSLGLLAGIGSLAIPGVGPFIAAGAIMSALAGSAVGGALGGIVGALVGFGIPEYEAKRLEAGLAQNKVLVSVHAESSEEVERAKEIFESEGAHDISTSSERSSSSR